MPAQMFAVRITRPYERLAPALGDWAMRSTRMVCYEHNERADNVHCHLLLTGVYCDAETLKNDLRKRGIICDRAEWSFKSSYKLPDGTVVPISEQSLEKYITYMSKGKLDARYILGFKPTDIDVAKAAWVVYKKKSKDLALYDEFKTYLEEPECRAALTSTVFDTVRERVHNLAGRFIHARDGVINIQSRRDIKMLKDSWLLDNTGLSYINVKLPFE